MRGVSPSMIICAPHELLCRAESTNLTAEDRVVSNGHGWAEFLRIRGVGQFFVVALDRLAREVVRDSG